MANPSEALFISDDRSISWLGAYAAGAYLNSATVTWTLYDASLTEVATGDCTYQASSNGNYVGTIESTVTSGLTENATYFVDLALSSGSYNGYRRLVCKAQYRRDQ